jgi:ubiquinol-cytochrome c reductase iron-sulfur subunit
VAKRKEWLIAGLVLLLSRRRSARPGAHRPRIVGPRAANRRAELVVLVLLGSSSLCAVGFIAVYVLDRLPAQTQLLGLTLGFALLALAAALIVAGKTLVPDEELVELYAPERHPSDEEAVAQIVEEGTDSLTRRRLLKLALLGTAGTLGAAALVPAVSFGPLLRVKAFFETPWRRGRRLVDESGRPLRAADIRERSFYQAFPEGADKEELGSPLVVVRLRKGALALPDELAGYDAEGIVAYSAICTHAGCAISMYRAPLFPSIDPRPPALVCPCHYSTFDPANGGSVIFGPAGRNLPMLPLQIDGNGFLRAKGNFNDAVGPSWWGVRNRRPKP